MARGLVRRIFDYLLETGRLKRGDVVIDPFGGIGTTGLEGASRGVRCFACELEPRFVDLAKQNIELHRRTWEAFGDPLPVIVQGDSRRLCEALGPLLADCVVGSPPYAEAIETRKGPSGLKGVGGTGLRTNGKPLGLSRSDIQMNAEGYGHSPGQLGAMPSGSVDAVVSSPPYEGSIASNEDVLANMQRRLAAKGIGRECGLMRSQGGSFAYAEYQNAEGSLGAETGPTFWHAAREIVAQCHAILKPSGVCVWVCKDFVRAKKRVPFSADWVRLCESEGFRLVEWIEASLVKTDSHPSLFGGEETKTTERKSFFRRLAERKGSPRIDHEDVLVMEKRGSNA